jgi:hypothetical protein
MKTGYSKALVVFMLIALLVGSSGCIFFKLNAMFAHPVPTPAAWTNGLFADYFRLSGGSMRPESQALGFLKGEMDFGDNVRVVEFALWSRESLERFGSHIRPEVKVFKGI